MSRVATVLGTMEMGRGPCVGNVPAAMISTFLGFKGTPEAPMVGKHVELDTAILYCGGETERILGEIEEWKKDGVMGTKVNPRDGKGLGAASIRAQLTASLGNLKVDSVQILYLHSPDHETPLKETLKAVNDLHKEGKFREFGLSNYAAWIVADIVHLCRENSWISPTVYQGMYSAITRQVEAELLPCLRHFNIRFYGYSPLGGGILTGKHKFDQFQSNSVAVGRFNGIGWDNVYRSRYWHQQHFEALENLKKLLESHHPGASVAEAALRWVYHHSELDAERGDAVILGASKLEHLEENLGHATKGPLAKEVVDFFDDWWASTKHLCPNYHR